MRFIQLPNYSSVVMAMNTYAFLAIGLVVGVIVGFGLGYAIMAGSINSLEGQVYALQTQTNALQAQNNNLSSVNQALIGNITVLQEQNEDMQDDYTQLANEYSGLQDNYTGLSEEFGSLQANFSELQDIIGLNKQTMLETGHSIAFGSLTPVSMLNYTLPYPGLLQINASTGQFGGIFECFVINGDLSAIEDFESFFNLTEETFELSGSIYMYMGTGPFSRTLTLPVLPGNNTVVLVYVGDTIESTTMTFDIQYIY